MRRTPLKRKGKERKQCKVCGKKRELRFYDTPRSQYCQMCKIAIKAGQKKEKREAGKKVWIKRIDDLIRPIVRNKPGECESPRPHVCNHNWQWCHGLSRGYHHTRWMLKNGFKMCKAEHKYFTEHPLEWEEHLENVWGEEGLREMKKIALNHGEKIDYKELFITLSNLKGEGQSY